MNYTSVLLGWQIPYILVSGKTTAPSPERAGTLQNGREMKFAKAQRSLTFRGHERRDAAKRSREEEEEEEEPQQKQNRHSVFVMVP